MYMCLITASNYRKPKLTEVKMNNSTIRTGDLNTLLLTKLMELDEKISKNAEDTNNAINRLERNIYRTLHSIITKRVLFKSM